MLPTALERSTRLRALLLVAGLVLPQVVLFGSSLRGKTVLLPLDILTNVLLPPGSEVTPHNRALSDLVLTGPQARTFSATELRAGRLPLWNPLSFAGAPFAHFGKYNPFELLFVVVPSPVTLAWMQLLKSIVAGIGAYLFFRAVLAATVPAALIGAWCYPLTAFFMLWQGFAVTFVTVWLPWILLATRQAVVRPAGWGGPALAVLTAFALLGGQLDVAAQVLLTSGIFALWTLFEGPKRLRVTARAAAVLVAAWMIGFAWTAPYWLPLTEYARTGARMAHRAAGTEERPPGNLSALPQLVVPGFHGTTLRHAVYLGTTGNQLEGASSAYAGLLATLLAAPLAWCGRQRRSAWFWLVLGLFAFAWQLGLPGVVPLLRLPGLNLLSHNRFTFVTSFAVVSLAVMGLSSLRDETPERRWWFVFPTTLLLGLGSACVARGTESATRFASRLEPFFPSGQIPPEVLHDSQAAVSRGCLWATALCLTALFGWWVVWRHRRARLLPAVGFVMIAELFVFAWDLNPQSDPRLYYPRLNVLDTLARAPEGRVLGFGCLPANLHESYGLHEIRGYDGVDPKRLVDLLAQARDQRYPTGAAYAVLQIYVPTVKVTPDGPVQLPAILDMLNVRYLLVEGPLPRGMRPFFEGDGYSVFENPKVLPRVSVPRRVQVMVDQSRVPVLLAAPEFDPREIAYVDRTVTVPDEARGNARILDEVPSRVRVAVDMQTAGVLLLADQWYDGWRAYVNDHEVLILRTNYALRGVEVPVGHSTVVFRYEPKSVTVGVRLLGGAVVVIVVWAAFVLRAKVS